MSFRIQALAPDVSSFHFIIQTSQFLVIYLYTHSLIKSFTYLIANLRIDLLVYLPIYLAICLYTYLATYMCAQSFQRCDIQALFAAGTQLKYTHFTKVDNTARGENLSPVGTLKYHEWNHIAITYDYTTGMIIQRVMFMVIIVAIPLSF